MAKRSRHSTERRGAFELLLGFTRDSVVSPSHDGG